MPPRKRERDVKAKPAKRSKKQIDDDFETISDSESDDSDLGLPSVPARTFIEEGPVLAARDCSNLELVPDHASRPIWVIADNYRVFVETFAPNYTHATDLLIAIAEPVGRPKFIHEYVLTAYSLYAAVSAGMETKEILSELERLSKNILPKEVVQFVEGCTQSYGKAKLVLQRSRFFVEAANDHVFAKLLVDPTIKAARVRRARPANAVAAADDDDILDEAILDGAAAGVRAFEIEARHVEEVKKQCLVMDLPLLEEYDYRNDVDNIALQIERKPAASLRPYQQASIAKMFGNGRARSGIIVLPCGAGKTLVGVTAASTIKKSCLVLCTSAMAVEQWREQFLLWADVDPDRVARFTADNKDRLADSGVVITTYSMISHAGKRSQEAQVIMSQLEGREWGLLLLDEVHVVPAHVFRRVVSVTHSHCKLGLTATLVREDDRIADLNFLIGPKLYEANWMELTRDGYIANVQCIEVWCRMTPEFFSEYDRANQSKRKLLYAMNPTKFRACEYLINYHEARGDKVIVFSDDIFALEQYAKKLGRLYIYGKTSQTERMRILHQFTSNPTVNTIFLSKVGDNSIDLPDANVLIQISSHYGSRRQEAQRLGRILRAKFGGAPGEFNAHFYSLVSTDTQEMYYSAKRQQFLVDQGYAFTVKTDLVDPADPGLHYTKLSEQLALLSEVMAADDHAADDEEGVMDFGAGVLAHAVMSGSAVASKAPGVRRSAGNAASLTGAMGTYVERPTIFKRTPKVHPLFKKRYAH
eukprot:TRINITY_DN8296_c0_g2_i1.p1 TRINITY_DN8296_c0_g2~~TRINITY_DN8296_c0_g2_i1.p1  ORF type:complete len:758 (-),score=196.72 TRINITY_DN8296_c0_g2_i1:142-2415(-)